MVMIDMNRVIIEINRIVIVIVLYCINERHRLIDTKTPLYFSDFDFHNQMKRIQILNENTVVLGFREA